MGSQVWAHGSESHGNAILGLGSSTLKLTRLVWPEHPSKVRVEIRKEAQARSDAVEPTTSKPRREVARYLMVYAPADGGNTVSQTHPPFSRMRE
jgi:hypothetical protein